LLVLAFNHIKPKQQKPKGIPTKVGNTPKKLMVFLFLAFETKKSREKHLLSLNQTLFSQFCFLLFLFCDCFLFADMFGIDVG